MPAVRQAPASAPKVGGSDAANAALDARLLEDCVREVCPRVVLFCGYVPDTARQLEQVATLGIA